MKIKNNLLNLIGIILTLFSFLFILSLAVLSIRNDIWYDEVFSLVFANASFREMISLTASDVHPPFYYIYLKLIMDIGKLIVPTVASEVVAKAASIIPWLGLGAIALTFVRQRYGLLVGGLFLFLVSLMPNVGGFFIEIRMYSLALFLVVGAFVSCILILEAVANGSGNYKKSFVSLFIFGILAAYTQYFTCIAIIGVYLVLFIGLMVYHKKLERNYITMTILSVLASVLLYIPWLPFLLKQLKGVSQSYWIQPMNLRSIPGIIKYLYLPSSGYGIWNYIAAILAILATAMIVVMFILSKPEWYKIIIAVAALIVPGLIVIVGYIASMLGHPIFTYRYIIPAAGVVYMALAYMLGCVVKKDKLWALVLIIPFLLVGYLNQGALRYEEGVKSEMMPEANRLLSAIGEDDVVITNFDQTATLMDYYLPDADVYFYEGEVDPVVRTMFGINEQHLSEADAPNLVDEAIKEGHRVYFLGSFNSREEIVASLSENGVLVGTPEDILIERYWINVYQLELMQ